MHLTKGEKTHETQHNQAACLSYGAHAGETDRCYNDGTIVNYQAPKTGDDTPVALWTGMALLSALALCGAVLFGARRKAGR